MKKIFSFVSVFIFFLQMSVYGSTNIADRKGMVIKNSLFSVTMPEEFKRTYNVKKESDKISIYHKESKKAGFGGFAFGIKAYESPVDHATLPGSRKIGELSDKNGILYDVVLKQPTDVQYDYIKTPQPPKSFKQLYDYGEDADIKGIKGSVYYKNQGMKGDDLYRRVLQKHLTAINEKWDSEKLEKENMSYMYNVISKTDKNPLKKIGYTYYDVNADGIEELFIGEISDGNWKGIIYDIYTMVNRNPKHVTSGGARNRYYVCDGTFICNEYSSGANESGVRVYNLVENSTKLFPQVNFKYDGYENSEKPWFISYSDNKWENVTEQKYNERKKVFEKYERFDYIPFKNITANKTLTDKYDSNKDYFDYSVVLAEYPNDYYYTTVKINKSKERILIVTDKITNNKNSNRGLFYYIAKNGFVYPLGCLESSTPFLQSKNYLYLNNGHEYIRFYMSDKNLEIIKLDTDRIEDGAVGILFEPIKSAEKFAGEFGSPAGDDIKKVTMDGFYFEYHKSQYKKTYIKKLMQECINDGVKTQVQMYCCMVKKLHQQ